MKIGIFFSGTVSAGYLEKLFEWLWIHRIINVFVAHFEVREGSNLENLLNIFTFNPFGIFHVINVTESDTFENLFLSQQTNFQQHPLRIGVPFLPSSKFGKELTWQLVCRILNASCIIVQGPESNLRDIPRSRLFENETMDIVMEVYVNNEPGNERKLINMYPMLFEDFVIVVPAAKSYPKLTAYLITAMSNNFLIYSFIIIVIVIFQLSSLRYIKQKEILFFQSVADVLNLLMNDNTAIKYQKLSRVEVFLIVPLTFVGMVFVNGILTTLQSHFTRPFMQSEINTIQDLYKSPFPLLVEQPYRASNLISLLQNVSKHGGWNDKIHVTSFDLIKKEISKFNTSISFLMPGFHAQAVIAAQKRLNIRGYHISQLRVYKVIASHPVIDEFPFIERLNEIMHALKTSGMYEKWLKEDGGNFVQKEIFIKREDKGKQTKELSEPEPDIVLSLTDMRFIVYGWLVGIFIFVVEIIWKKIELNYYR